MSKIIQIAPAPAGMMAHFSASGYSNGDATPVICLALVESGKDTEVKAMIYTSGNELAFADESGPLSKFSFEIEQPAPRGQRMNSSHRYV